MEVAIERFVALACLVVGLSHIFQPRAWARLFIDWREKGVIGGLYAGLLHFPTGLLIVAFHNVWHGIPLLVTLLGWGWTFKGALYLINPKWPLRMLERVSLERAWEFVVAGAVLLVFALLIAYSLLARFGAII